MELLVLGVTHRKGVSYKSVATGKPYEICVLQYLVPVEPAQTQNSTFTGHGLEVREIQCEPTVLEQFAGHQYPKKLNIDIRNDPRNLSKTVAHGILK